MGVRRVLAIPDNRRFQAIAMAYAVFCVLYLLPGHFPLREPSMLRASPLDRSIPFLPWSMLLYISHFAFLFLTLALPSPKNLTNKSCQDGGEERGREENTREACVGVEGDPAVASSLFPGRALGPQGGPKGGSGPRAQLDPNIDRNIRSLEGRSASALTLDGSESAVSWARVRGQTLAAMLITTAFAALVFVLYPTTLPRVEIPKGAAGSLFRLIYATDVPGNCLPSLHCGLAGLAARALYRRGGLWRITAPLWALAIALSTLTTRQHIFVDLVAGAFVATIAGYTIESIDRGVDS